MNCDGEVIHPGQIINILQKKEKMQMRKKILAVALAATMVFGLVGCGSSSQSSDKTTKANNETQATEDFNPDKIEDSKTIEDIRKDNGEEVKVASDLKLGAIAKSFSNEFWRNFKNGYEQSAKVIKKAGVDITVKVDGTTDEGDEIGQQTMTDNLVNQGYSALMLSPISDSNLTSSVDNAKNKKIPTVNVNDGLISAADYFVGPDAYQNGELAAEWVSKKLGDKGDVAIVVGMAKAFAARERTAGFKGWIKDNKSGLNVVAEQNADWDRQKAKELASTWIQQKPDLKAIFCNNDDMALGVVEAVEEAKADILVVGVDGIGEAYDSIKAGKLDATVDSFGYYMSQVATEVTLRILDGQDIPRVVHTPQALIDSSNVNEDAAQIIGWKDPTYVAK
mgnify:CR=1 FL=1